MNENATPAFIHSTLDDYGLHPAEFRVFCRISRRGSCTESIPNIARACHMHEKTVRAALGNLIAWKLVNEERRPGNTTIHTVNPMDAWLPPVGGTKIIPHPSLGGTNIIPHPPTNPIPQGSAKVIPQGGTKIIPTKVIPLSTSLKGNPIKGEADPRVDASLKEEEEVRKLEDWQLLKEIKDWRNEIDAQGDIDETKAIRISLQKCIDIRQKEFTRRHPVTKKPKSEIPAGAVPSLDPNEEIRMGEQVRTVSEWRRTADIPDCVLIQYRKKAG